MNVKAIFLTASLALGLANAQASLYGQCGGTGYSGATSCVSGAVCTSYNPYYYQCVPGTSTSVAAITTVTSTSTLTTITTTSTSTSVSTSTVSTTTTTSAPIPTGTKYFITFGDSYSQTGFDPNSTLASASNILGNPAFPGYTTTNGDNWIDFLISEYNTSLTLSYNFAYGGATVNASIVAPYESTVLSLIDQVTEFSNSIASKPSSAPWATSDTLVGVWMGVNDVGNSYWLSNETAVLTATMDSYFGQLEILYDAGVRNFVLLNCPPTDKSPLMLAEGSSVDSELASVIAQFNDLLSSYLTTFIASNSGVIGQVVDTQAPFNKALDNPTAYGAANATCYDSDGTTCLWWNNYHPGQAIHNLTAQAVASALPSWFN